MTIADIFRGRRAAPDYHPALPDMDAPVSESALEASFEDCCDFKVRDVQMGARVRAKLYFIDGLVDGRQVSEEVLRPLTDASRFRGVKTQKEAAELMMSGIAYCPTAIRRERLQDVTADILAGCCAVVLDDIGTAVTFEVKAADKRAIDEPKEEKVIKGSKDVFIELIRTNSLLVRRRIRSENLKFRELKVGRRTKTQLDIVYIKGLTNMGFVREMERRLSSLDIDGVLSPGDIESCISDSTKTPFPQLLRTERPDRFCMNLLEGRVGLLMDGLPMGFLAPGTFGQFFKVPEDRAQHFVISSVITLMRYAALLITLLLPAFYVAVAMYHQEMLPTKLMLSVIESKQAVPFSTAVEVLAMLIAFEILQEAGLRLPNPVGETVSIIGGLVVGQSAVEAKVVSPVVVIIVAMSGIAGYTIPDQDMGSALRICRFLFVLAAIGAGMFGIAAAAAALIYHLSSLETFGVAYMEPFSGGRASEVLSAILMRPKGGGLREEALKPEDARRRADGDVIDEKAD